MAHPVQTSSSSRTATASRSRTTRTAAFAIIFGLVLLALGALVSNDDVLHAGGVGFIVFGAMAYSLETESPLEPETAPAEDIV